MLFGEDDEATREDDVNAKRLRAVYSDEVKDDTLRMRPTITIKSSLCIVV